ncbi:putative RNA polymerase II transcriptional coactivator [Xylona heveae TC161]|uniref:Putative RNA polymerase II transcriptional coactivator n=1 Tax=Xylona heveae (strain CBS 132557 / TC161) TaxID=1328760 RepID=A0A165A9G9_XYLHT|nr:putative RNA polymerase II transcriptional coactivator [Xylona heveae TC161]KZF20130.1 putative RNA polymerase II transcriptional coactivator [Xylona heveae TC161]
MPPKSKKRVSPSSYDSDGGFVAADDEPATKKARTGPKGPAASRSEASGGTSAHQTDDEGNPFWELSKNRRVTVSSFRGKTMVSIREYYEKDGKHLPGKKGISLPIEHYTALISVLPAIEGVLVAQGQKVPRPDYNTSASPGADEEKDTEGNGESDEADEDKKSKQNFEATSDEDENDD